MPGLCRTVPYGVPYIIVGKYTYPNGFGADTKLSDNSDKTMGDQLIERILEIYQSDNRYDVMEDLNNKKDKLLEIIIKNIEYAKNIEELLIDKKDRTKYWFISNELHSNND